MKAVATYLAIPDAALQALPTPSLVADLAAIDRNIVRLAHALEDAPSRLRPHFKAHKCTELMRRQLAGGNCVGVTVATVDEAEACARAGFPDILIANEFVDPDQLARAAELVRDVRLTVVVDDLEQVRRLDSGARSGDTVLHVLIDVDTGLGRTGVGAESTLLLELAAAIGAAASLELDGVQGYEGHAMLDRDRALRELKVGQSAALLDAAVRRLERDGHPVRVVSGGGTGTFGEAAATGLFTEIQAGSYVLMDGTYGHVGLPFEPAFGCLATVISRKSPWTAALNAGTKSISGEKGPPGVPYPGMRAVGMGDEHCRLALDEASALSVGDRILLQPAHVDPTVNLHDVVHVWDGLDWRHWAVDGRRATAAAHRPDPTA